MDRNGSSPRGQAGQAGVELVGVLPLVVALCAVVWQLALAGHAAWAVSSAARAAARAHAIGTDPRAAARGALPTGLERRLRVREAGADGVRVAVRIPTVVPALRLGDVSATARFAPQGG